MPTEKEPVSSPESSRKSSKPIMEKRRRARINASLSELKSLLLEVMKKEGTRHNKMEKADILEMTVKHLRQIQRQQFVSAANTDPSVVSKYQLGFAECATEVTRYLSNVDGVDVDLKTRMLNHLANNIQSMTGSTSHTPQGHQGQSQMSSSLGNLQIAGNTKQSSQTITIAPKVQSPAISTNVTEINNNCLPNVMMTSSPTSSAPQTTPTLVSSSPQKVFGGIQLFPSRMPNGDVAFIIPGNVLTNNQMPGYVIPLYAGSSAPVVTSQQVQAVPLQTGVPTNNAPSNNNTTNETIPVSPGPFSVSLPPSPPVDLSTPTKQSQDNPMNLSNHSVTSNGHEDSQVKSHGSVPSSPGQSEFNPEVVRPNSPVVEIKYEEQEVHAPQKVVPQEENVWRPW